VDGGTSGRESTRKKKMVTQPGVKKGGRNVRTEKDKSYNDNKKKKRAAA